MAIRGILFIDLIDIRAVVLDKISQNRETQSNFLPNKALLQIDPNITFHVTGRGMS